MRTPKGKDATCDLGRTIHLAHTEAIVVASHRRPAVVVLAAEEYERLRAPRGTGAVWLGKNTGEATVE